MVARYEKLIRSNKVSEEGPCYGPFTPLKLDVSTRYMTLDVSTRYMTLEAAASELICLLRIVLKQPFGASTKQNTEFQARVNKMEYDLRIPLSSDSDKLAKMDVAETELRVLADQGDICTGYMARKVTKTERDICDPLPLRGDELRDMDFSHLELRTLALQAEEGWPNKRLTRRFRNTGDGRNYFVEAEATKRPKLSPTEE